MAVVRLFIIIGVFIYSICMVHNLYAISYLYPKDAKIIANPRIRQMNAEKRKQVLENARKYQKTISSTTEIKIRRKP